MALRLVNGVWKGGTKKDAAKLKAQSSSSRPSTKSSSSRISSNDPYAGLSWADAAAKAQKSGVDTSTGSSFDLAMNKKYNPSNYEKLSASKVQGPLMQSGAFYSQESPDSSRNKAVRDVRTQREQAAKAVSKPTQTGGGGLGAVSKGVAGMVGASPITTKPSQYNANTMSWFDKLLSSGRNIIGNLFDGEQNQNPAEQLNQSLGLSDPQVEERQQDLIDRTEELKSLGFDEQTANIIATGGTPAEALNSLNNTNTQSTNDRRTSHQVTNPFVRTPSPLFSASQTPEPVRPDYTPIAPENGTRKQFPGNGYLSTGQYGNGAGNYGIEGSLTGTDGGNGIMNDLLNLLQIQTAQAAGMDTFTQPAAWTQPKNDYLNSDLYKQTMNQMYPTNVGNDNQSIQPSNHRPQVTAAPQQSDNGALSATLGGYDAQMKAQKKALKSLLKSIESQYKTATKEGTEKMNKSKQEDLLKLSGLFSFANADPNDEQRAQYQTRTTNDYATQLKDFLGKLAASRKEDISQANTSYQDKIANLMQQREQAQAKISNAIPRGYSSATSTKAPSRNEIFNWVNQALDAGGTWDEIAQQAAAQGIPVHTGSYIDELLNNANKQNRFRA